MAAPALLSNSLTRVCVSLLAPCSLTTVWNSSRTTLVNTIGVALSAELGRQPHILVHQRQCEADAEIAFEQFRQCQLGGGAAGTALLQSGGAGLEAEAVFDPHQQGFEGGRAPRR